MGEKDSGDRRGGDLPGDFEGFARVYGEAMLRIGRLEERVEQLAAELRALPGQESQAEAPATPIETHESQTGRRQTGQPQETGETTGEVMGDGSARDEDLRHMRSQIASLANQLANTEGRLNERLADRRRHRRKQEPKPWWGRLRNRVSGTEE